MSKKLDNLSLLFSSIGFTSIIFTFLYLKTTINVWLILISIPISLFAYLGVIIGIIALMKKPVQKWKPIVAIIIFLLTNIINALLFLTII